MFGKKEDVEPMRFILGSAFGWGNPGWHLDFPVGGACEELTPWRAGAA
jgi:hypothetical protein